MNSVAVRQAVLSDLPDLASLFDQYRQFQGRPSDPSAAHGFLRDRFEHGESVLFLARDEHAPVGFAQLYPSFSSVSLSRVFILNDLFVHESARRKGVASALLAALCSYASSLEATRVSLNVMRSNIKAQALYEADGWVQDQEFFMYHWYPGQPLVTG